jgi:hypothetical protein
LAAGGSGDDFRAGVERAIALGWLWRRESGTYVKFTSGAALFAQTRASMPVARFHKREQRLRYLVVLDKASAQLVGDIHGHVTGPAFRRVEGHDPNRVFILPIEQVADQ